MRQPWADARIDVAVIPGKDRKEIYMDFSPALAIHTGEKIYNGPPGRSVYAPATPMTLVEYCPCYRSEAGTGEVMAFMYWASGK